MSTKKKILFVDDEPNVLSSLRRSLRREGWDLLFAKSGDEGLEYLTNNEVDLIVSDMRMPEIDGIDFLKQAQAHYPHITRLVMTGYANREAVRTAFTEVEIHEMIPKPWEVEQLRQIIRDALKQAEMHESMSPGLHKIINELRPLPSLPQSYKSIVAAIDQKRDLDAQQIAAILLQSPPLAARIMQIANSSFFGQRRRVDSAAKAVVVLGIDIIKSLALLTSLEREIPHPVCDGLSAESVWQHSATSSAIAYHLAQIYAMDATLRDAAVTACALHDVGKLVLANHLPAVYAEIIALARCQSLSIAAAENQILNTDHARLGGCIIRWWNMPQRIVEAISCHHTPESATHAPELVHLVHLANVLSHHADPTVEKHSGRPALSEATQRFFDLGEPQALDQLIGEVARSRLRAKQLIGG
jgi:HD-like signal output (HDOD) protein/CheY-like chemotaxis protein